MEKKRVYTFGNGKAEGNANMRNELGGKGANLAEMNLIGVPVPPGFTITTDVCNEYYEIGKDNVVAVLKEDVLAAVKHIEGLMNSKLGDATNPLLLSVRSGARASMPGMMDTILNLGLNDEVVEGLSKKTGNPRFAWDSYRRFVQMYGDVVMGLKPVNKTDIDPFEAIIEKVKEEQGVVLDKDLSVESLKKLVALFKAAIKEQTGQDFPTDPIVQLWGAICAVFRSWMNERAILYRKMEGIPDEWGTAVSVMAMVFGNMGETSATGVCFSRDAGNGENLFNGEYLVYAAVPVKAGDLLSHLTEEYGVDLLVQEIANLQNTAGQNLALCADSLFQFLHSILPNHSVKQQNCFLLISRNRERYTPGRQISNSRN